MATKIPRWLLEEVFAERFVAGDQHWRPRRSVDADARAALKGIRLPEWRSDTTPQTGPADTTCAIEVAGPASLGRRPVLGYVFPHSFSNGPGAFWSTSGAMELQHGVVADDKDDFTGVVIHARWRMWRAVDLRRYAEVADLDELRAALRTWDSWENVRAQEAC